MAENALYIMSFSSGGLSLRESMIVTNAYLTSNDWDQARTLAIQNNLLQARIISSASCLKGLNLLSSIKQLLLKSTLKKRVVHHGLFETN